MLKKLVPKQSVHGVGRVARQPKFDGEVTVAL
jgi:hypothetical protein